MIENIDLRSDTVTQPCQTMRQLMANAKVGDDVTGDDPTVNELEAYVAKLLGKEAAIFATSGVQANLIALMGHCGRGDEYIVGQLAHTYRFEGGGSAVLGSIQPQPLNNLEDGSLDLQEVAGNIKDVTDIHYARTRLLCLENTFWGKALPMDYLADARALCDQHGLALHLDGARMFNAVVHHQVKPIDIAKHFDSVSICLSKGLGAPVGSVLAGSERLIKQARHYRKMLGGGMRQAGIVAAGGLYALQHNIDRLIEDHHNAQFLAAGLSDVFANVEGASVIYCSTNMVFVQLPIGTDDALAKYLASLGIVVDDGDKQRLVTYMDVDRSHLQRVIDAYRAFFAEVA